LIEFKIFILRIWNIREDVWYIRETWK